MRSKPCNASSNLLTYPNLGAAIKWSTNEVQIRQPDDSGVVPLIYKLAVASKTASYAVVESDSNRCLTNVGATAVKLIQGGIIPKNESNSGGVIRYTHVLGW